jgi:hypothetical protein
MRNFPRKTSVKKTVKAMIFNLVENIFTGEKISMVTSGSH